MAAAHKIEICGVAVTLRRKLNHPVVYGESNSAVFSVGKSTARRLVKACGGHRLPRPGYETRLTKREGTGRLDSGYWLDNTAGKLALKRR